MLDAIGYIIVIISLDRIQMRCRRKDIENLVNQVHKLVMLPGEEIIHVLPQEFKVDSQADIKEPIGMYGGRLEANFHVVVGQVSSIRNIGRCVKSAGLDLSDITLEPLASASAVLSNEEKSWSCFDRLRRWYN